MVFFNHATRQMTTKIVYYGPGLCGKTTNLNTIYGRTSQKARGEMVSLNTETDRTLFFDLLPMDVGTVSGFRTKLQLYTVPGQVFYNSTRKLVLKGVDGIVFVADSQTPMFDANKESLQNLKDNLRELGLDLKDIPIVFQWNKRDLKNILSLEELERELNPKGDPSFQAIASDGTGVFETLRGITRLALTHIRDLHLADSVGTRQAPEPRPERVTAMPAATGEEATAPGPYAASPALLPPAAPNPAPAAQKPAPAPAAPGSAPAPAAPGPAFARTGPPAPAPPAPQPASPPSAKSPVPQPLTTLDLPAMSDFLADEEPPASRVPESGLPPEPSPLAMPMPMPAISPVQVMPPIHVKVAPGHAKGAAPLPKVAVRPPHLAPAKVPLPPKPALKPVPVSAPVVHPKPARPHAELHLDLSPFASDGGLEVEVIIRQNGGEVGRGTLHHEAPAWGASGTISLEIRRP